MIVVVESFIILGMNVGFYRSMSGVEEQNILVSIIEKIVILGQENLCFVVVNMYLILFIKILCVCVYICIFFGYYF